MTYYKYDYNYIYTGSVVSNVPVSSATTTAPIDDKHILYDPNTDTWNIIEQTKTLDDYIREELINAKNYYEDMIVNNTVYTAEFEDSSYSTQETEWREWVRDPINAYTPYVNMLSDKRGLTKGALKFSGDISTNININDNISTSSSTATIASYTYNLDTNSTDVSLVKLVNNISTSDLVTNTTLSIDIGTPIETSRDISVLMNKIGNKLHYYASIQGDLHMYQDMISSCTTIDEVLALTLPWRV